MSFHPLPKAVLAQHTVILGKTRSGKSSTMRGLVEELLDDKKPVCIIDPKGDWWGLKSSASGKRAGYEVVIFGGVHADVPINAHSGAVVGDLVATGNRPCIIDLGGWMVGERTRFFIEFASTLFKKTHGARWLCIDECHNFAPQGKIMDPDAGKMLHWANRLASEGAGKGLTLISASQRPQKVHKDYLTSHETLIAMRVIHPLDRKAMKEWMDGCADPTKGAEVLNTLAGMQRGEAWVWSPEIDFGPKRIQFPMFKTYDSFAVQTGEAGQKLSGWAAVDLDDVKAKLASVVEEAKANDPRELRAQVAALKGVIEKLTYKSTTTDGTAKPDNAAIAAAEKRGFDQAQRKLRREAEKHAQETIVAAMDAIENLISPIGIRLKEQIGAARKQRVTLQVEFTPTAAAPQQYRHPIQQKGAVVPRSYSAACAVGDNEDRPLGAERKPLAALASVYPAGMTESQWAVAAGFRRTGGTWNTYVSRLRTALRVVRQGELWFASELGIGDLGTNVPTMPPPGAALVDFWAARVPAAGRLLRVLAEHYPNGLTRDELAAQVEMTSSGGSFNTYLSRLRSPGLIEEQDGQVRASRQLMERAA